MKRNVIISVSIAAIITALIFLFPKNGVTTDTLSEILEKTYSQLKNDHLLHDSSSISPISALLDSTCLKLSLSLGERTRSPEAVDSLISQIYHKWQIGFNSDDFDLTGMFPQSVIQSQKGSCLGVSLLFLTMAEKIGCPLYGVIIPGHVFIRYDDGIQCRNIEPNREGISHPDDYYRERYLSDHSRTKPLNKASAADLVAILNYNIANSYAKQNKTGSAIKYYKKSIATKPGFAEAWGNLALLYDRIGKISEARKAFDKAYKLQPDLCNLAINLGCFELNHGNPEAALRAIKAGLEYYPENPRLKELFEAAGKNRDENYN